MTEHEHMTELEVAAYVDGRLSGDALEAAQAHMAQCRECRGEVVAASRLVAELPLAKPALRSRRFGAVAALAAAVLIIVAIPRSSAPPDIAATRERGGVPTDAAAVALIAPAEDGTFDPASAPFVWHALAAVTYRVTLTDSSANTMWTREVTDTVLPLPANSRLSRGARYHWYVEAIRSNGSTARSEIRSFLTPGG
jgi:hypothetical protein